MYLERNIEVSILKRDQENKKKRKKTRTRPRKRPRKKEKTHFFLDHFLGRVLVFFLFFFCKFPSLMLTFISDGWADSVLASDGQTN